MLQRVPIGPEFSPEFLVIIMSVIGLGGLLYAARWLRLLRMESKAQNWTRVSATVHNNYEIDENAGATSAGTWIQFNNLKNASDSEYVSRWAVAIEYVYQADGKTYPGAYFLPHTYTDGHLASEAGRAWMDKNIIVRFNPHHPEQSVFMVEDGAPGEPHIPKTLSSRPHFTTLSLK